jgi:Flp pilus assembly protein TadD
MDDDIRPPVSGRGTMPGLDMTRAFQWSDAPGVPSTASALFRAGTRPVIRWIKGTGLDDVVTRSAIAQATRLFGRRVDYCLCTAGIDASRVRDILAWASEPVDWWPLSPADNPELAALLMAAGCEPRHFGYWWKWFPERVRPDAPEWILDGDMVVTGRPDWFDAWCQGKDRLRVSEGDEHWPLHRYYHGEYRDKIDKRNFLYSGLVSLPPGLRYMPAVAGLLEEQPLQKSHDGRTNMSEQGVMAAAFAALDAAPIPLAEFPFGRATEEQLDFGFGAVRGSPWGYHFGNSFKRENHQFARLVDEGTIFWQDEEPESEERFRWLRTRGQWGGPSWSMNPACVQRISSLCDKYVGRAVLEFGTSRGMLTAIMLDRGCVVTCVDREDRGATDNLAGLNVCVMVSDAAEFLRCSTMRYAMITVDFHGNEESVWRELWPLLKDRVEPGGTLVLYNSHLWMVPGRSAEFGLKWLLEETPENFTKEVFAEPLPGMIVLTAAGTTGAPPPLRPARAAARNATLSPVVRERQPEKAVRLAAQATTEWPDDVRLYDILCTAYESLSNWGAALESARRTVALAPHHPAYRERLARLLVSRGHLSEAETEVRQVLALAPERASAHHLFSIILSRLEQSDNALFESRKAVGLDPERPGFQYRLGLLALRGGFLEEAELSVRRAIASLPQNADNYLLLSKVLERQGNVAAAIEAAANARRLDPKNATAMKRLVELERRSSDAAKG